MPVRPRPLIEKGLNEVKPSRSGAAVRSVIVARRRGLGLSQHGLAEFLAMLSGWHTITRFDVSRWERGARLPGAYWRPWLSVALDCPLNDLKKAIDSDIMRRMALPPGLLIECSAQAQHYLALNDIKPGTVLSREHVEMLRKIVHTTLRESGILEDE